MIFNKSFSLVSNDAILSAAEVLPTSLSSNFLFSNYYSVNRNYFNYNDGDIIVLKDIKCDIKMYANPFIFIPAGSSVSITSYPNIRLEVKRNDSIRTIINRNFVSLTNPIYELKNIEFKENDIINCYARSQSGRTIHSIAGYLLFLKE